MKRKSLSIILLLNIFMIGENTAFAHLKSRYRNVLSCKMINGDKIILKNLEPVGKYPYLEVDGKEYLADGDKPYLEINGKTSLAFDKDDTYGFVTELLLTKCIQHTLIVTMDMGSPYLRELAIRQNPITHQYERIDFAQKALPKWLYFKNNQWGVILPNIENGYEVGKKYIIHFYNSGTNQPALQHNMKGSNHFPVPKNRLIRIPVPKDLQ